MLTRAEDIVAVGVGSGRVVGEAWLSKLVGGVESVGVE